MKRKKQFDHTCGWVFLFVLFSLFFVGCRPSREFKCIRLDRDVIQKWINSGYIGISRADSNASMLLQFYTPDVGKKDGFRLVAYPANGFTSVQVEGKTILPSVDSCRHKLSGGAILGNNFVFLNELNIIDTTTSKLINFQYILFTPVVNELNYMVYKYEVVTREGPQVQSFGRTTYPCPPYCPPH